MEASERVCLFVRYKSKFNSLESQAEVPILIHPLDRTGPQRKHVHFGFVFFLSCSFNMQSQWFNGRALGSQDFPAADPWINENESEQEVHKSDDSVEEEAGFSSDTA